MTGRKWTTEEIIYLKENYGVKPTVKLASKLNRTECAIIQKIKLLEGTYDLHNVGTMYTTPILANILKISDRILNDYRRKKGLPFRKLNLDNKRTRNYYDGIEVWAWIHKNLDLIDLSRYEEGSLLPEPQWYYKKRALLKKDKKPNLKNWTEKEIQLMELHMKHGKKPREILPYLDRTYSSIQKKYSELKNN